MKNNKWFKLAGAAVLGLMILGFAVPSGQTAPTVTLTALVQDQQCQGGDFVNVTLTATLSRPAQNVRFQWDFNNDGVFDTPLSSNPTVSHLYPDEVNVTAGCARSKGVAARLIRSPSAPCVARTKRPFQFCKLIP